VEEPRSRPVVPVTPFRQGLNDSQLAAVATALASQDICLIHGPPGTGKTTTVVELIRQAVARGERVCDRGSALPVVVGNGLFTPSFAAAGSGSRPIQCCRRQHCRTLSGEAATLVSQCGSCGSSGSPVSSNPVTLSRCKDSGPDGFRCGPWCILAVSVREFCIVWLSRTLKERT
jgi:hypothetical protein